MKISLLMDWAVEELRCLASYKATGGEWDEKRCREILETLVMKANRRLMSNMAISVAKAKTGWESEML